MLRLGLKTEEEKNSVSQFSSTSRLNIPDDLPSIEDVLRVLCEALEELNQPGLNQANVFR